MPVKREKEKERQPTAVPHGTPYAVRARGTTAVRDLAAAPGCYRSAPHFQPEDENWRGDAADE